MSGLLDFLISVKNQSGAIPTSPTSLKNLKSQLTSVPVTATIPGMSTLMDVENVARGLVKLISDMGSLSLVGNFKNILSRVQAELGVTDISKVTTDQLVVAMQRTLTTQELEQAVGLVTSMGAALGGAAGTYQESVSPESDLESPGPLLPNPISFQQLVDVPTTIDGYGITDGVYYRESIGDGVSHKLGFAWTGTQLAMGVDDTDFGTTWPIDIQGNAGSSNNSINAQHANTSDLATNALHANNADFATNAGNLGGQAPSYYTDVPSRLGYTPVNKAGDTITGNLSVDGFVSARGSVLSTNYSGVSYTSPSGKNTEVIVGYHTDGNSNPVSSFLSTADPAGAWHELNLGWTGELTYQGYTVWTTSNFNPSDYVPGSGGTVSGNLTVTGTTTTGRDGTNGYTILNPGNSSLPGYLAFYTASNTRVGYAGWGDGTYLVLEAENGYTGWRVENDLSVLGTTIMNGARMNDVAVGSATDLSKHLQLYTGYGLSITGNTLNYVSNLNHQWYSNGSLMLNMWNGATDSYQKIRMMGGPSQMVGFVAQNQSVGDIYALQAFADNGAHSYLEIGQRSGGNGYIWVNGYQWTFGSNGNLNTQAGSAFGNNGDIYATWTGTGKWLSGLAFFNTAGRTMWFNWSGQSGQPSYLMGSNDGTNFYVWTPSNFSVNYATSSRYLTYMDSNGIGAVVINNSNSSSGQSGSWRIVGGVPGTDGSTYYSWQRYA